MRSDTRTGPRQRRRCKIALEGTPAFTVDVSTGGFCAELMRVMPAGTVVNGTISVEGQEFSFSGRVAWSKAGDARANMRGRMGICFTNITPEFGKTFSADSTSDRPPKSR